jgi:hypothetical protein
MALTILKSFGICAVKGKILKNSETAKMHVADLRLEVFIHTVG